MCQCNPNIWTPYCGRGECVLPNSKPEGARANPMTDKLPEFVEQWILQNECALEARDKYGDSHGVNVAIDAADLRAFLAKFVLCQRTSSAVMHVPTGALKLADDGAYWGTNWVALHAPATEESK